MGAAKSANTQDHRAIETRRRRKNLATIEYVTRFNLNRCSQRRREKSITYLLAAKYFFLLAPTTVDDSVLVWDDFSFTPLLQRGVGALTSLRKPFKRFPVTLCQGLKPRCEEELVETWTTTERSILIDSVAVVCYKSMPF
jgi:hypothetical protein